MPRKWVVIADKMDKMDDTMQLVLAKSSRYHLSSDYDDSISVYAIMRNGTWFHGGMQEETLFTNKTPRYSRAIVYDK